ncbi:LOB domain-containing protein 24 isoform X1 [Lactuca sativa]|nr:LOB domain-containing protein 24 isoform X1 [Lactuca sativa]
MSSNRCAVCKYFRRRCPSNCIFSPHFPPNNPQRFTCVHRIYGASNIGKMLEELAVEDRAIAVETLYYEAKCRVQDPVYGCAGLIPWLQQELNIAQSELAKTRAQIALVSANYVAFQQNGVEDDPSNSWFS